VIEHPLLEITEISDVDNEPRTERIARSRQHHGRLEKRALVGYLAVPELPGSPEVC